MSLATTIGMIVRRASMCLRSSTWSILTDQSISEYRSVCSPRSPEPRYPSPGPSTRSREPNGLYLLWVALFSTRTNGRDVYRFPSSADVANTRTHLDGSALGSQDAHLPPTPRSSHPRSHDNVKSTPDAYPLPSTSSSRSHATSLFGPSYHLPNPTGRSTWTADLGALMTDGSHMNELGYLQRRTAYVHL
jgi:hypothetical protein